MNWIHRLQRSRPMLWAAIAFLPFTLITCVASPISFLWDFCEDWWNEFKVLLDDIGGFHSRLWYDTKHNWKDLVGINKSAWRMWLNSAKGNKEPVNK